MPQIMNRRGPYWLYFDRDEISVNEYNHIYDWCYDNFGNESLNFFNVGSKWYSYAEPQSYTFAFMFENDFTQFRLTWL